MKLKLFIFCLFFITGIPLQGFAVDNPIVIVIRSRDIPPYNEALKGFKKEIKKNFPSLDIKLFDLNEMNLEPDRSMDRVRQSNPKLVFAIGTEAAVFTQKNFSDRPIIFSMVLDPTEYGVIPLVRDLNVNITGVSLNIEIEHQFRKLKEILPTVKRIGMIYNADKKSWLKDEAVQAAKKMGLEIVAEPVYSQKDVFAAIAKVIRGADCLWAAADNLVYNPKSAEHILLMTLRHKIPFISFSTPYVKAGALMAFECDYYEIGRQSARLVQKVLQGQEVAEIPVDAPEKVHLVFNRRTAKMIGVEISQQTLAQAHSIFGD